MEHVVEQTVEQRVINIRNKCYGQTIFPTNHEMFLYLNKQLLDKVVNNNYNSLVVRYNNEISKLNSNNKINQFIKKYFELVISIKYIIELINNAINENLNIHDTIINNIEESYIKNIENNINNIKNYIRLIINSTHGGKKKLNKKKQVKQKFKKTSKRIFQKNKKQKIKNKSYKKNKK